TIERRFEMQRGTEKQKETENRRCSGGLRIGVFLMVLLLLAPYESVLAQKRKKKSFPTKAQPTLTDRVAQAKADVISAGNEYKKSLQSLLKLQEDEVKTAAETVERRKELLAQNIIAKKELEESERALAAAQARVTDTKKQMGDADNLIAEAKAEEQLVKLG